MTDEAPQPNAEQRTDMTAAVWTGPNTVETRQVDLPEVPEGWALIRMAYNGICGTDLAILHGQHPRAQAPLIMGHEMSGWVERAGASGPAAGALVVVEPLLSCGDCKSCRDGNAYVCRNLGLYGIDVPGGLAQYVALPPEVLHEVPATVDPRTASLVEPLAVAVHAVDLSGMDKGDTVAIYGAGPIGVLTALVARHAGAGQVVITEPSAWRRSIAEGMGFTVVAEGSTMAQTLASLTDGEGADTTFDTAAHPSVAAELTDITRVLGRIVIVGTYKEPSAINLRDVCFKEQTVSGVRVYTTANFSRAIDLIASNELGLGGFPTKAFGLDQIAAAFDAAVSGQECLKVLVTPLAGKEDA